MLLVGAPIDRSLRGSSLLLGPERVIGTRGEDAPNTRFAMPVVATHNGFRAPLWLIHTHSITLSSSLAIQVALTRFAPPGRLHKTNQTSGGASFKPPRPS